MGLFDVPATQGRVEPLVALQSLPQALPRSMVLTTLSARAASGDSGTP